MVFERLPTMAMGVCQAQSDSRSQFGGEILDVAVVTENATALPVRRHRDEGLEPLRSGGDGEVLSCRSAPHEGTSNKRGRYFRLLAFCKSTTQGQLPIAEQLDRPLRSSAPRSPPQRNCFQASVTWAAPVRRERLDCSGIAAALGGRRFGAVPLRALRTEEVLS